jgi:hypothetical protein
MGVQGRLISSGDKFTEAKMDQLVYSSGSADEVMAILGFRINYTGAAWSISSSHGPRLDRGVRQ